MGDRVERTATLAGGGEVGADAPFALPPRWRPARRLGQGGQAEVWLAWDAEVAQWVAVKVFHERLTSAEGERLRREVRLGRQLAHPGLVRVFELIEAGDRLAVLMEWIAEGSLADLLVSGGPLPIARVVAIAEEALDVLAFLHEQRVVHRDVKPSNLLLDAAGRLRLADLGLARPLEPGHSLTRTAVSVGTPGYMSPEQIRGEEPGPATDLYALGATLYQLLTGRLPYEGGSDFEVADLHLRAPLPDPRRLRRDCPRWLARFVMRLLEKRVADRFLNAAAARCALLRHRSGISPRRLRRGLLAAGLVVASVAGGVAGVRARGGVPLEARITDDAVTVADARGRVLFRKPYEGRSPVALVADVVGDGRPEVIIGLHGSMHRADEPDLLILDHRGEEVERLATGAVLLRTFAGFEPITSGPQAMVADSDGDGRKELFWVGRHGVWFPSILGAWDARRGSRPGPAFANSGHIRIAVAVDVDGDGAEEIVLAGINNALGWQAFVAIVFMPGLDRGVGNSVGGASPDLLDGWAGTAGQARASRLIYTLLGTCAGQTEIVRADRRGIVVSNGTEIVHIDTDGNPLSSPLAGRGAGARRAFLDRLVAACREIETNGSVGAQVLPELQRQHEDAFAESGNRLAAYLLLARSLARAGRGSAAIRVLEEGLRWRPGDPDLELRLGEQLAIAGRSREALSVLERATHPGGRGRLPADAMIGRLYLAALVGDKAAFDRAVETSRAGISPTYAVLWPFFRGAWEERSSAAPLAQRDLPIGPLVHAWCELERGGEPAAALAAAERGAANPETAVVASLLRSRALLAMGRAPEALDVVSRTLQTLPMQARTEIPALCWLAVAERVAATAAGACGDRFQAASHDARARALAPHSFWGRDQRRVEARSRP